MLIVTTGYMCSGSSAVTDLLSELRGFSNVSKTQEYIFLHCPNGLFDLENKLLNPVSHLSSKQAIIDFRDMMRKLYYLEGWWPSYYRNSVSDDFMKMVDEFIESIIDYKFKGFWYMDEIPQKRTLKTRIINYYNRKVKKLERTDNTEMILSYPSREKFYEKSKIFIDQVVKCINKNKENNVIVDQLLLPLNLHKLDNYFKDTKVIVVERDPRDVFILNEHLTKINSGQVPFPLDAKSYCEMYKNIRNLEQKQDNKNILRIKFEDLIYNYDSMIEKIYNFLGVDKSIHVDKKIRFNPDISIQNTQLFHQYKNKKAIKVIEDNLKEYLYDFPYIYDEKERNIF